MTATKQNALPSPLPSPLVSRADMIEQLDRLGASADAIRRVIGDESRPVPAVFAARSVVLLAGLSAKLARLSDDLGAVAAR